ncbi:MAG TPA: hypothetical protein VKV74_16070 [Bryobacteraceae bacterium]|nr:hypothetical protein [Bryobacteraceae bacterium]
MPFTIDPNLYNQIGLDSGSLTMLGSIVHSLGAPGQYRVALHRGETVEGVCFITADNDSPAAQVTVDLASSATPAAGPGASPAGGAGCGCGGQGGPAGKHLTVNPKGYVLFRVSGGSGGYYVHVRRIDADQSDKGYDSRVLGEGDLFTAILLRPGTYSISNTLTKATGQIVVPYPKIGTKPYVPPPPARVSCGAKSLEPARVEAQPGQAVIFEAKAASRIVVKLEKADDGPGGAGRSSRPGLRRIALK